MEALVLLIALFGGLLYLMFQGLSSLLPGRFLGQVMALVFFNILKWFFSLPFRLLRRRQL